MRRISTGLGLLVVIGLGACSADQSNVTVEHYKVAYRQFAPEPVYGRFMWAHMPQPIMPKTTEAAPYYLPEVSFQLPDTTLGEAIEALAQTMGYRWDYPSGLGKRRLHIRMDGTVEEVLAEIGKQGGVQTMLDHEQKLVRVVGEGVLPSLPDSK